MSKITILNIFDSFEDHMMKKKKKNSSHETSQTSAQLKKNIDLIHKKIAKNC